ncbi:hypothetical protein BD413DRAFT_647760, partial [Trametes elegans]
EKHKLFNVTTTRWLYNDEKQRIARHLPFDLDAFTDIAAKAAHANACVSIEKIYERRFWPYFRAGRVSSNPRRASTGNMNRVFFLKFDNDVEFIAKLPYPAAGPKHYTTASEVATLDYLRTVHGFPVPHVRAWCSGAESSPVGAEFIMYERLPGRLLHEHELHCKLPLEKDPYVEIIPDIQHIETHLFSQRYSQIGSIYYENDVTSELRGNISNEGSTDGLDPARFCIGPTVDREFWRSGRAALNINRGPWPDVHSYMRSRAACARASIQTNLHNPTRSVYSRLISEFENLIPHLAPAHLPHILWHPNLSADEILVTQTKDAQAHQLSGIIDWQGATVSPAYEHIRVPPAFSAADVEGHPLLDFSGGDEPRLGPQVPYLDVQQRRLADALLRRAQRAKAHEVRVRTRDPALWREMYSPKGATAQQRVAAAPASVIMDGVEASVPLLEHTFVVCRRLWDRLVGVDEHGAPRAPFPLEISQADERRILEEVERVQYDAAVINDVIESLGVLVGNEGAVDADKYDDVQHALEEGKQALLSMVPPQDRERLEKAWPFQEGKTSLGADLCT